MSYYAKKPIPCIECGTPTTGRLAVSHAPLCTMCGVKRSMEWGQMIARLKATKIETDTKLAAAQARCRDRGQIHPYPRHCGVRTFT